MFIIADPVGRRQYTLLIYDRRGGEVITTDCINIHKSNQREKLQRKLAADYGLNSDEVNAAFADAVRVAVEQESGTVNEVTQRQLIVENCRFVSRCGDRCRELCNFAASIAEEIILDDGLEQQRLFAIHGTLANGQDLPRIQVVAGEFERLEWIFPNWGSAAIIEPGRGVKDEVRAAIQLNSGGCSTKRIYSHLGWRQIGEQSLYLHSGGAIGESGAVIDVLTDPPGRLKSFSLPPPPTGGQLTEAILASLALADVASDPLGVALLGAVYRSVLGQVDFSLFLEGSTGAFKTSLAAVAQQHFGRDLNSATPCNWDSTANAVSAIAFAAKDAVLLVDDFCPLGSRIDAQRVYREADRVLRGAANGSGRQRLRPDGKFQVERFPRGLILATGEDVPPGASLRSRLLILPVERSEVRVEQLTALQRDGHEGRLAMALSGFVCWLARRYPDVRDSLGARVTALRDTFLVCGAHPRTAGNAANLFLGLEFLLDFACEVSAIDGCREVELRQRFRAALQALCTQQVQMQVDTDPNRRFLELIRALLLTKQAHLATLGGEIPRRPDDSGWLRRHDEWQSSGRCVGWADDRYVFLDKDVAFSEAQALAERQGGSFPVQLSTLVKRLATSNVSEVEESQRGYLYRLRSGQFRCSPRYTIRIPWRKFLVDPEPREDDVTMPIEASRHLLPGASVSSADDEGDRRSTPRRQLNRHRR